MDTRAKILTLLASAYPRLPAAQLEAMASVALPSLAQVLSSLPSELFADPVATLALAKELFR